MGKPDGSTAYAVTMTAMAVIAVVGIALTWRLRPHIIRGDLDRLEQRVEALEAQEGE
jgi:hypothetical protein